MRLAAKTPMICVWAFAGFDSGPARLKMVRKPSDLRTALHALERRIQQRRVEKGEAGRAQTFHCFFGRQRDGDAERLEHVRRAAGRGHRAIAVLGDFGAGGGGNQRGSG